MCCYARYRSVIERIGRGQSGWHHLAAVLVLHLVAIAHAQSLNLTSVAIVEDDAIPSPVTTRSLSAADAARTLLANLDARPWNLLRLSGDFNVTSAPAGSTETCHPGCRCVARGGSVDAIGLCDVASSSHLLSAVDTINLADAYQFPRVDDGRCLTWDSSAYAVHRRAFPAFARLLQRTETETLTTSRRRRMPIDALLSLSIDQTYAVPALAVQEAKPETYESSLAFGQQCMQA